MPTDAYKTLKQGLLPTTAAAAYTVPVGATGGTVIPQGSVVLVNHHTAAVTASVFVNGAANVNRVTPIDLSIPPGGSYVLPMHLALAVGESIQWVASVAAVVAGLITGDETT